MLAIYQTWNCFPSRLRRLLVPDLVSHTRIVPKNVGLLCPYFYLPACPKLQHAQVTEDGILPQPQAGRKDLQEKGLKLRRCADLGLMYSLRRAYSGPLHSIADTG